LTAESEFSLQHDAPIHSNRGSGLNEIGETAGNAGFEAKHVTGFGGAENFNGPQGSEFEAGQGRDFGVGLGDDAGELGGSFDKQHAGKDGLAGEVTAQEWFIAAHGVFAAAAFAGVEGEQAVEETKFRAVRKMAEGCGEGVGHG